jgi:hypothetical protein
VLNAEHNSRKKPAYEREAVGDLATDRIAELASVCDSEVPVVSDVDVDRLYRDVLYELGLLAQRGGSAVGAAAVVKRVALAHGVASAEYSPLPRLNRAELAELGRAGVSRERARRAVPRGR